MELFSNFTDFPRRETKTSLQRALPIMLTQSIFVPLVVKLDPDASEVPFFEDAILNYIVGIESTDALEEISVMFSHTQHFVLFQNKSIASAFVEAFLVSEEPVLPYSQNNGHIARNLLLVLNCRASLTHERYQKFLKGIHILGEMLSQGLIDFAILDR